MLNSLIIIVVMVIGFLIFLLTVLPCIKIIESAFINGYNWVAILLIVTVLKLMKDGVLFVIKMNLIEINVLINLIEGLV